MTIYRKTRGTRLIAFIIKYATAHLTQASFQYLGPFYTSHNRRLLISRFNATAPQSMKGVKFVRDVSSVMIRRIQRLKCVLVSYDVVTLHRIKCINYDDSRILSHDQMFCCLS